MVLRLSNGYKLIEVNQVLVYHLLFIRHVKI